MEGYTVAQLVEALLYKSEGRASDISLTESFRPHCGSWDWLNLNRNEYQEHFMDGKGGRCVGMTTLPSSCANCLEIWDPQPSWALWACNRPDQGFLYLCLQLWGQSNLCYLYKAICDWTYVAGLSPRGIGLKLMWLLARFVVDKVVLEKVYLRSSSIFPSHSLLHSYVIVIQHCPLSYTIALMTQNTITSLIVKLWAPSLTWKMVRHCARSWTAIMWLIKLSQKSKKMRTSLH